MSRSQEKFLQGQGEVSEDKSKKSGHSVVQKFVSRNLPHITTSGNEHFFGSLVIIYPYDTIPSFVLQEKKQLWMLCTIQGTCKLGNFSSITSRSFVTADNILLCNHIVTSADIN